MTTRRFQAGNTVRSTITFAPLTGTVSLADVSCRVLTPVGVTTATVVADSSLVYHADIAVPDASTSAEWVCRWESNAPSAKIAAESTFSVYASALPSP